MKLRIWEGKGWRVEVSDAAVVARSESAEVTFDPSQAAQLRIDRRRFRRCLMRGEETFVALRGLGRSDATQLSAALRYISLAPALSDAILWRVDAEAFLAEHRNASRWITQEKVDALQARIPFPALSEKILRSGCENLLTAEQSESAAYLDESFHRRVQLTNDWIMANELESRRVFFEHIEASPLSEEQARAVVCFDNRVQLLAAAGSGKTSVMIARAAYAVERGLVAPDRILLLAFNRAAAAELQKRIDERFAAAGIASDGVRASTFHAFGLEVIGRATGRKPRLAHRLEQGDDVEMVLEIVDQLREGTEQYRYNWDLYRLLFAGAPTTVTGGEPDGYDKSTGASGYRTCSGVLVKSLGERMIADFLFFNGVHSEYERSFSHDLADASHSQYLLLP
jgi:DNA helicase-4